MDQDNEIDRLRETELWNNNNNISNTASAPNDLTLPSSITAFDPIQQQELEQLQALLDPSSSLSHNEEQQQQQQGQQHHLKNNETSQCWIRALIFIGYCISTVFFSIHLWIQYFFVKYTYDDQTAVNMLNYVTAAQEQAIDEYLRKTERRRSRESDQ